LRKPGIAPARAIWPGSASINGKKEARDEVALATLPLPFCLIFGDFSYIEALVVERNFSSRRCFYFKQIDQLYSRNSNFISFLFLKLFPQIHLELL